jgi:RNA polymerase sigma-70 factor, ECF subfamily
MAETGEAIQRFLEGEEQAFDLIVQLWEKKIYNLSWRMLGNREDAQDIVQETFLSVFKSIRNLRDPGSFSTWLYQIALNHCRIRQRSRSSRLILAGVLSDKTGEGGEYLADIPAARNHRDPLEDIDLIRKALLDLSEDHRTAIVLKEYIGLSLEELASVMKCPLSTAKSRLYHGLREVQRNLKRLGIRGVVEG